MLLFPLLYMLISHLLIYLPCQHHSDSDANETSVTIYLYAPKNGIFAHSEIIVPLSIFERDKPIVKSLFKGLRCGYAALSYGDKGFMQDQGGFEEINYPLALKALLLPTPALMKVALMRDFDKSQTVAFALNASQTEELKEAILGSFRMRNGDAIPYNSPLLDPSFDYYEAKLSYNLFYTCNSWSGRVLWHAGVCVSPWTPFGYQLRKSIRGGEYGKRF